MRGFPPSRDKGDGSAYPLEQSANTPLPKDTGAKGGVKAFGTLRDRLAQVALAWPALPQHIQNAIMALIEPFAPGE